MKLFKTILPILVLLTLFSCRSEINNYSEYVKWINAEENGLVKEKRVNKLLIKVKYLPAEYLVYRELKGDTTVSSDYKDSLIIEYKKSKTFLLTIGPDPDKPQNGGDIMLRGVSNMEEFKNRSLTLNFDMREYIELETDNGTYLPVLTHLENVYGITSDRDIMVSFSPNKFANELKEVETLDFIFNDEIFNTGRNHFVFTKEDIDRIPKFTF